MGVHVVFFCAFGTKAHRTAGVHVVFCAFGTKAHRTAGVPLVLYTHGTSVHRTAAVPLVLYVYGTRCLAYCEEQRPSVFREDICGSERER